MDNFLAKRENMFKLIRDDLLKSQYRITYLSNKKRSER